MSEDVRRIGFNSEVQVGARALHVQTEIVGRGQLTIRTLVLEQGTVRFSQSELYPVGDRAWADAQELVRLRHADVVSRVAAGEVG